MNKKSRLSPRFFLFESCSSSVCFHKRTNALGAQHLAHQLTFLKNAHRLQIGPERPASRLLRPGAISPKSCRFSAMRTLRHNATSLYN